MIKTLIQTFTIKSYIKIMMMILIIGIFFIHPTFAAETTHTEYLTQISDIMNSIMKFCSRSWIVLAVLAGKFMTNDMLYGSRLHLDQYLWQIRNVSKNFANFGLLGFMLYEIIQFITNKGKASIQGVITKGLMAGILIQSSWFIVGAIVDISTIATSAIASFPGTFINTTTTQSQIENLVNTHMRNKTIVIDKKLEISTADNTNDKGTDEETKAIVAKLMPNSNSVAGPLVFIGASALKIQDMMDLKTDSTKDAKSIIVNFGLKGIILLLYFITLLMLLVANVIRVGMLWVIIAISPMLLLRMVFKDGKGFGKNFNLSTILLTIFKPAIFAGMLSIILIFVLSIQGVMTGNKVNVNGVNITMNSGGNAGSTIEIEGITKATINDKIFTEIGSTSASIFANIIIYFATLFLLRYLIKLAITSGGGPIEKTMESMTSMTENFAKTAPIIGGYSRNARSYGTNKMIDQTGKKFGIDLNMNKYNRNQGTFKNEQFEEKFNNFIGGNNNNNDNQIKLQEAVDTDSFIETTKEVYKNTPFTIAQHPEWEAMFQGRFQKHGKKYFKAEGPTSRETFKNNTEAIKKLDKELGGTGDIPTTYDDLKKKTYGKQPS